LVPGRALLMGWDFEGLSFEILNVMAKNYPKIE